MMSHPRFEVRPAAPGELSEALGLLEAYLRDGESVPPLFIEQFRGAVERGDLEVLVARAEMQFVGVVVVAFRLNVSAGALFASIEDLYIEVGSRQRGIGRALLDAVEERCRMREVSYIEVQTDEEGAVFYLALGYEPEYDVQVLSRSFRMQ